MKTVYKYHLTHSANSIKGPITKLLCVHEQRGDLCIWAEVDLDAPEVIYDIHLLGTGSPKYAALELMDYIGSIFYDDARFVFHVYAKRR